MSAILPHTERKRRPQGSVNVVEIDYTNWRGVRDKRLITPIDMFYGTTEFHKERGWLLKAWDHGKREWREFAMNKIHSWVEKVTELPKVQNNDETAG